jgi:hypothetical protein
MPWYKAGTISVTQNSTTVTGTGTSFSANSRVGDALILSGGQVYEVTNIASATVLSISPAYQGSTASGQTYALAPMQGYVKDSADALRALVNQFGGVLAVLGQTPTTAGVRDALGITNTDGMPEGSNKYYTDARVRGAVLAGMVITDSSTVVSTDAVVAAFGKLQAQVSTKMAKGANNDITSLTGLTTALSVEQGGTGGKTQSAARTGLGLGSVAVEDTVPVNKGGTGATTAAAALTSLGAMPQAGQVAVDTSLKSVKVGGSFANLASQGLYLQWNTSAGGISGEGAFVCNRGSGDGGFSWRSVNAANTLSGPVMTYTYAGVLNVPGAVNQGSDRRLKINDVEITDGLERIMRVRPVEFDRRDFLDSEEYPHHEVGVIAQELFDVTPLLVTPANPDSSEDIWRVNYTGLIPYLVSAIKTLKAEIEELKAAAQ